jgi:hypothetical protein
MKKHHFSSLLAVIAALALTAAACGSDAETSSTITDDTSSIDVGENLPLADDTTNAPLTEGACLPDEPDCEDTIVIDADDVTDLSDTTGGATSSGMPVDGGLSITEALASPVQGIIAVRGHLFDKGSPMLCEKLVGGGEGYVCEGERISVANVDLESFPDIVFLEGTTYTEEEVTLFGELIDGTLTVDELVAQ